MNFLQRLFGRKRNNSKLRGSAVGYTKASPQPTINERANASAANTDYGDWLTSMAVGYMTDSAITGALIGGDPMGAIVGEFLRGNDPAGEADAETITDASNEF